MPGASPNDRVALPKRPAVVLLVLVLVTFLPCLWNGFVSFDDPLYVTQNSHVNQGLTGAGIAWAWRATEVQNWHPLTWISHELDVSLFGLNPAGHHATNVLFHCLNTVLLFLLLERMTGARWRSFTVAALFGLHPLRVESVAWVAERKDVLSVCFCLLTMWAYLRYTQAPHAKTIAPAVRSKGKPAAPVAAQPSRLRWYCAAILLFVCGLLSKPMLVTLPFVLLLLDYWPLKRWPQSPVGRLLVEKLPFLVLAVISSVVTYWVQQQGGAVTTSETLSLSVRLDNALVSYVRYLGMTFCPVNLCIMYPHPGHWPDGEVAAAGIALAVLSALALWQWRARPYLPVGWFWFLGTLVPAIGIIQVGRQALADRYTYLPSIGLWLAVVWGVNALTEKWRDRQVRLRNLVALIIVACMVLTIHQITFWRNTTTLFARARQAVGPNWIASGILAGELEKNGKNDEAVAMYQEALQLNPHRTELRCQLASLLLRQQRTGEALQQFETAVAMDPGDVDAHYKLGGLYQNLGRLDEAIDQFNQTIQLEPNFADAYSDLGNCYGMKDRTDDALRCFEQAVKLKPASAENHVELGVGFAHAARWDDAIDQFQQAVQLDPSDAQAQTYLDSARRDKAKAENAGGRGGAVP